MIAFPLRRLATTLIASALLIGCAGKDGSSGANGSDGFSTLVQITPESAGANCAFGGTRIQSGVDSNRSGLLEPAEVGATQFVCNGATGATGRDSLLSTSPEGAGSNCATGGIRVQSGLDLDGDRTLDAVEVTSTQYVCGGANGSNGTDGLTSLLATLAEPAGSNCALGGIRVQSGVDADADGTLDPAEVVLTRFVCNGTDGTNGSDGLTALVNTTAEPVGANCAAGGTRLDAGLDSNRDGALGAGEITSTQYACDGAAGAPGADGAAALLSLSSEPAGSNCAAGGTRVDAGLDLDRDGTLDASEISSSRFVCNGASGADGLTSLVVTVPEAAGANCLHGGVRLQSGLDADRDALLDPAEIAATQYVCNGADGPNGLSALVATAAEGAGADCQWGGTRVLSGLDADRDGTLDAGEVTLTQFVCDGAPGADGTQGSDGLTSLVSTSAVSPGPGCQFGGTRVDAGLDADRDGTLDPGEIAATQYVCNGAAGAETVALLAMSAEPAGSNCPYGGTRVQSGLDTNGSGVLDPSEVQVTQFVCNADSTHPTIVTVTPPPGSTVPTTASFCATFSEPLDPTSIDFRALTLEGMFGNFQGQVTYDAGALRACFVPAGPLDPFVTYKLHVGGAGSSIRDLAGNQLVGELTASYWVDTSLPIANLRVTIDSVVQNGGQVDVQWTVWNSGVADAGPFELGLFGDPAVPPGIGAPADVAIAIAGLAQGASFTSSSSLPGTPSFAYAFVDLLDQVMEQDELDNLAAWAAPGAIPSLTGPISVTPMTQEEGLVVTITIPVNASARRAELYLTDDLANPMGFMVPLGTLTGNTAGEGFITGDLTLPTGAAGVHAFGVAITDAAGVLGTSYAWFGPISDSNLTAQESMPPFAFVDSGFPLTFMTVTPSTRPNLTIRIDGVLPSAGGVDIAYTVSNTGISDSGPFTLGLFVDPVMLPGVGASADATQGFPMLAASTSLQGMVTVSASTDAAFYAYVDLTDAVQESNEGDNLASAMPTPPAAAITAPVGVQPPSVQEGQPVDLFIPVNGSANVVIVSAVGAPGGPNDGRSIWLGQFWGNSGGEGFLAGQIMFAPGDAGDWILEFEVADATGSNGSRYYLDPAVSPASYAVWAQGALIDSGLPLATVTVVPDIRPNLRVAIDSVTPSGGTIDIAYTVTNVGAGDAGGSTLGLWANWNGPGRPGPGIPTDLALAVGAIPAGGSASGTATLNGNATSNVLAFADLDAVVDEANENDNLGGIPPAMTGSPIVVPSVVELTGGITVTVPVSPATHNIEVYLTTDWPGGQPLQLGNAWGNDAGEGSITGTFSVPPWYSTGDYTVSVRVANRDWVNTLFYVGASAFSGTDYAVFDDTTGAWAPTSSIPLTSVTVIPPTHANLQVRITTVTPGAGTVDVSYVVVNNGFADAGAFTLGLFADPLTPPGVGATPEVSVDVAGLAAGDQLGGTATLTGTQASALYAFVDVTDAVVETNESDNLSTPPPALLGTPSLSPAVVDQGTLLTVTLGVNATTQNVEVFLGSPGPMGGAFLGNLNGNHSGEGSITGTVAIPMDASLLGTFPVTFILHDDRWTVSMAYTIDFGVSPFNYALVDPYVGVGYGDSGIPIASVTVVVPTRPNLTVSIDAVTDMGDGTVNVDYTVRNTGVGDSGGFDLGFFVDPAALPDPGTPTAATLGMGPLAMGAATTGTINVTGSSTSALFAYADLANAVDEQSETDNLGWSVPPPQMTGQPTLSAATVAEGSPVTVTVPVSAGVRRVEVYLGGMMPPAGGEPAFLIGEATLPASGASVDVGCIAPLGSAGSWYVWIATYDMYGLSMQAYVSFESVSTTYYTEFDPDTGSWPPSTLTAIPLTALDIAP